MIFNSIEFLIFLPIVIMVYYALPKKVRYIWLLGASYFFYMCWNVKYILLLVFTTLVTYVFALILDFSREIIHRKLILAIGIIINLSILVYFKYANFLLDNIRNILLRIKLDVYVPRVDVILPVGISFFIFQALGYLIDVYRRDIKVERNIFRYALFVSFFPQLVAGPIERSKNLMGQLSEEQEFKYKNLSEGTLLILWGLFLKIVIADRIAIYVNTVFGEGGVEYKGWYIVIAIVLFAFQIYCDFYGYSIIAMGSARMLGIRLMENFRYPYLATTVKEFWAGWHISLTSWFRDYIYIPLGGNRKGIIRKWVNIIIVFSISGLWHGASFAFVLWGILNGLYQVVSEGIQLIIKKTGIVPIQEKMIKLKIYKIFKIIGTFILIDFSWLFFRMGSLSDSIKCLKNIVGVNNYEIICNGEIFECGVTYKSFIVLIISLLILMAVDIAKMKKINVVEVVSRYNDILTMGLIILAVTILLVFGIYGSELDQSQFIYFQF